MDLELGFPNEIKISLRDSSFMDSLDYWREPFCCHSCWQMGHLKDKRPTEKKPLDVSAYMEDSPRVLGHHSILDPHVFTF